MEVTLGLRENWKQFTLLVIINAFVGGMVGLERTILPELAESEFNIAATSSLLSFIVSFGISKALTNYYAGILADKFGRKQLLIAGWIIAIPIPLILIWAPSWSWVVFANILLGVQQGLTWSSTVVMKIDLVGDQQRGLAMGINESAGYLAVGAVAFLSAWIAAEYGIRPAPFYLGLGFAVLGLFLSVFLLRDTIHHVARESTQVSTRKLSNIFWETTWKNPNLGSVSQAGLVNNLNDGMVWGLLPVLLMSNGFSLEEVGKVAAVYPVVWGLGQLVTGAMADRLSKKWMLVFGMLIQAIAIGLLVPAVGFSEYIGISIVLGIGTAVVYPTFLAAIADHTHPDQRARSIGVFRLWRDLGYAVGAVVTGIIADLLGIDASVYAIAIITFLSALTIWIRMER